MSLTPLVDVVFILLIFFLLALKFSEQRAIELDAPVHGAAGAAVEGAILIRLDADGGLALNGERMTGAALASGIRARVSRRPDLPALIQPDRGVSLQRVVSIIDHLTSAGVWRISLLRAPGAGP